MPEEYVLTNEEFEQLMIKANNARDAIEELRKYWLELYSEANLRAFKKAQDESKERSA